MQHFHRYEFKYPMSAITARHIIQRLKRLGMEPDPNSKQGHNNRYIVSSLYLDSVRMSDYDEKAGGFLKRKKNRIRIYNAQLTDSPQPIWLEQKGKYEMRISKKRIMLNREQYEDIINGNTFRAFRSLAPSDHESARYIFYSLFAEAMKPTVMVRYLREPLVSKKWNDVRITFDSNIEACETTNLCYPRFMNRVMADTTVMEIKYSTILPGWFKAIIQEFNLSRTTFSKYALAVESIYRYHPVPR